MSMGGSDREGCLIFVCWGDGRELRMRRCQMRPDGANHHGKQGHREFCVWVNIPSRTRQVRVPIQCVISLIWLLLNPFRQVLPLISQMCSNPMYRCHVHPASLSFSSTTLPPLQNSKLSYSSLSLHAMIISCYQVQYTPGTIYTKYSIHQVLHT
jgi:hypothetical protein